MRTLCALAILAMALFSDAHAQSTVAKHIKTERAFFDYLVNADGTFSLTIESVTRLLSQESVRAAGDAIIYYADTRQTIEILSAYTLKADGKRIAVPKDNIFTRDSSYSATAPALSDLKLKVIVFPNVAPGDTVAYTARVIEHEPLFPGHFSMDLPFAPAQRYEQVRVQVRAPEDTIQLYTDHRVLDGGISPGVGGQRVWLWKIENLGALVSDSRLYNSGDPYVIVSSFKGYPELAKAYRERAQAKMEVTGGVRRLADEITQGITESGAQARSLYNWVSRNIRYLAVSIGDGHVVPNSADKVIENRYGDCKDHTTLLGALLAAKGIASTPALIQTAFPLALPDLPSQTTFNHVITYLPDFDVYLDSTQGYASFGVLPAALAQRKVLHIATGELRMTTSTNSLNNREEISTELRYREDGTGTAEMKVVQRGPAATQLRAVIASTPVEAQSRIGKPLFGANLAGKITADLPKELNDDFAVSAPIAILPLPTLSTSNAITIPPQRFEGRMATSDYVNGLKSMIRPGNWWSCVAGRTVDSVRMAFPKNISVRSIPKSTFFANGPISYTAEYSLKANVVEIKRELTFHTQRNICTESDAEAIQIVSDFMQREQLAEISYEPAIRSKTQKVNAMPNEKQSSDPTHDNPCVKAKLGDTWTYSLITRDDPGQEPVKTTETITLREITNSAVRFSVDSPPDEEGVQLVFDKVNCVRTSYGDSNTTQLIVTDLNGRPFAWPVNPGSEWIARGIQDDNKTGERKVRWHWKALGWETVSVQAGKFTALHVIGSQLAESLTNTNNRAGVYMQEVHIWHSPITRNNIKYESRDVFGRTVQRELTSFAIK